MKEYISLLEIIAMMHFEQEFPGSNWNLQPEGLKDIYRNLEFYEGIMSFSLAYPDEGGVVYVSGK